jgi:gluconokinase
MIIVVIGVTGAGKSTVGAALAERLSWRFIEADDFHPEANWKKLARGEALTDDDRGPWLARLRDELAKVVARGESAVLACSALKQVYRDALTPANIEGDEMRFVYLHADPALTAERLDRRTEHRASPLLLESQLATLEEPHNALRVSNALPCREIVQRIVDKWGLS